MLRFQGFQGFLELFAPGGWKAKLHKEVGTPPARSNLCTSLIAVSTAVAEQSNRECVFVVVFNNTLCRLFW